MDESLPTPRGGRRDRGITFLTLALLFTTLASIALLLRLYIRIWLIHAFGWDDSMILLATLLAIVSTCFNIPEVVAGYGQHLYYLSEGEVIQALKWNYLATPLLVFSLAASKISISLFLLRILDKTRVKFKRPFCYGTILLLTLIAVPSAGYALGQCQPVRKLWNPTTPGRCRDPRIFVKVGYANGVINAFGDFALALFPISFIKDLHLPLHRKIVLGLLMSCGLLCGSLAITRTILTGDLTANSDLTYDSVDSSIFAVIEENVSIIAACVPTLGPILQFFSGKIRSLRRDRSLIKSEHCSDEGRGKDRPIPLHAIASPAQARLQCHSSLVRSVEDPYANGQEIYGSERNLVPSIEESTMFGVPNGDSCA